MSMISELVKELRNEAQEVRLCSNECESAELLDRAADTIEILSAKVREPKWIPCSERLPARQGYYICTCKDGSRVLKTTTIKWSNGWQLSGSRAYWKVIAWMPLPPAYEGKGADDETD